MFSMLKRGLGVFYSSPARLLRFSLNNALRPYLKDELQQDNFELQLWQGIVNIENLELNETMLNKKLNGSVPFHITHARIGKLSMDIPWRKVATDSVRVDVHDVTLSISLSPTSPESKEDVERYMEKCLEKSLEHSQHIIEDNEDSMDENLGIQSVEELFENIFNNMNVAIHNIKIYIEKENNSVISLTINTMNLMNEPSSSSSGQTIKKMATFEGLSVDIESPVGMKGNVVKLEEKNSVHLEYLKTENISNVVVFMDLTNGVLKCNLIDTQFYYISHFFENMTKVEKTEDTSTINNNNVNSSLYNSISSDSSDDDEDMGKSLYESAIADSDEEHINALSNSILLFAPVQNPQPVTPSEPMDFTFKLKVKQFNSLLSCKNLPTLQHAIEIQDLFFMYHMLDTKTSMEVIIENMNLSEINGDSNLLLLKFLSVNPKAKPQPFKCFYDKVDRQGQIVEDVKLNMPILYIRWELQSFMNMMKVFQYQGVTKNDLETSLPIGPPPPKNDPKISPSLRSSSNYTIPPLFNLKIPRIQVYLDFASLQSQKHTVSAIDLEISEVRVRKIPIPENSTRKWFIEFDSANSWIINQDLVKRSFISIWTVDLEDKPRLEITTQEPSIFNKPIPSMMMDLDTVFSHPLFFSYFAKGTRDIMPIRPNNTVDFDRIKQSSGFILDLVFPNFHVDLLKSDFAFISMLTGQLSSDSTSASSTIATIGRVEVVLLDDIESAKHPNETPIEFRGDFDEFRCFQATFFKDNRIGSFILINNRDAILKNHNEITLLRKAPRQLRMDTLFCPPLAVTFPEFELNINGDIFLFESVTVGFKVAAWEQFVNFWIPEKTNSENNSAESNVQLKITNATIFYQPLDIAERKSASIVIAPPRAVFSVGQFYMKYSTNNGMDFSFRQIKLWLKEDFHYLKNSEIWLDMCHPDIATHLKNKSLVEVMNLDELDIKYVTKEKVSEISLNFLRPNMSPDSNPFVLSVRPDSFETLLKIVRALAIDFPKEGAPLPKPVVPVQKVDFEIVHAKKLGEPIELLEDYEPRQEEEEEEEEQPLQYKRAPVPIPVAKKASQDLSHSFILFDEGQVLGTSPDAVLEKKKRSIDPIEESWEWVGRVAPRNKPKVQDDTEKIFPSNIPKSMQIKLNNLVLCIRFMGGNDWRNEEFYSIMTASRYRVNKALESTQDSVDLQFDIPCISFDTFAPEQHSEWRLTLEIRRMLIEDHVKTSHNKNILTFTRNISKSGKKTKPSSSIQLWLEQNYKGSYKFKFIVKPMRVYLDQDTLNFLIDFFTHSSSSDEPQVEDPPQPDSNPDAPPLFDYFETSVLDVIVDYKPRMTIGQVYSDIKLGNNIWAIQVVELNKVPITLDAIKVNFVKDYEEFKNLIMGTWFKDFKHNGAYIYNIFKGTRIGQPVQICLNIGSGVIDLIKTPVEEYNKGGNVLRGIGVGATSLAQKITVELLNLGASSAITIKKGLSGIDKAITVHPSENLHVSSYANQPENLAEAASQATGNLKNGFSNSLNALYYGGIRNLPSAIIQPAIGTLEALSNLTLGVRNMIDKSEYEKSKEKYKTVTDQQELRKKPQ